MIKKCIFILVISLISINPCKSQDNNSDSNFDINKIKIPPLEVIMDSVLNRSHKINFREHEIEAKKLYVKSEKLYWTRNFGLQADSRYGTFDNFTANNATGQSTSTFLSTTQKQLNFGVGVYMKFPIFDGLNRKNQINLAKAELDAAESMAESIKDEIRQAVIKLYQELLLKRRILYIKSQNYGNGKVNMDMVEKEFRNGLVPVSEYVRLSDITSRIQTDFEIAKTDFFTAKKILEDMAGFTFD